VILRDGKIFVAHVGDSSVVFAEHKDTNADRMTARCVTVVSVSFNLFIHLKHCIKAFFLT
jgi:hypothetical protein